MFCRGFEWLLARSIGLNEQGNLMFFPYFA